MNRAQLAEAITPATAIFRQDRDTKYSLSPSPIANGLTKGFAGFSPALPPPPGGASFPTSRTLQAS